MISKKESNKVIDHIKDLKAISSELAETSVTWDYKSIFTLQNVSQRA